MNTKQIRSSLSTVVTAMLLSIYNEIAEFIEAPFWLILAFSMIGLFLAKRIFNQIKEHLDSSCRSLLNTLIYVKAGINRKVYALSDKSYFLLVLACVTICLLPAYVALFPGTFGYDGPVQLAQYFGEVELTTHHPIVHTYLLGLFVSFGNTVLNSYTAGFALYTAFQGIVVACSLAYTAVILKRRNVFVLGVAISIFYVVACPMIQNVIFSSTKDVLFGAFLSLFVAELINIKVNNLTHYIRIIAFGVLTCLFRNQGIYIMIAMFVALFLMNNQTKKAYATLVIISIVALFNAVINHALGISKGDAREMLCVPMNQMAYVASEHPLELTEKQLEIIEHTITWEGVAAFQPVTADDVKGYFQSSYVKENFFDWLQVYIELGVKYPAEYLRAWEWLVEGYWDTDDITYRGLAVTYTFEELNTYDIKHGRLFLPYYHKLLESTTTRDTFVFFKPELCLWVMLILISNIINKKSTIGNIILFTYGLYFCTVLLGPVALVRYLYPMTLGTPLLVGALSINR